MTDPSSKVGVALLNWNQYDDTARCLLSLRKSGFRPAMILVYDNGSEDGSGERLQADFPEIRLVRGGRNLGFSEGNNRAVKILVDAGMDLIWILNNDTEVEPDCLGALVRGLEADPAIGAIGAKIWFMDERKPLCYAGASMDPKTFQVRFRGLRERDAGQYDVPGATEILSGCCMLVRAGVVRRIGLFNQEFFAYLEDIEWSLRARENGVGLWYEPRAALWHKMYGASNKAGRRGIPKSAPFVEHLLARNWISMIKLHTRPGSARRLFALFHRIFLRSLPRLLCLLVLPGRTRAGWAGLAGIWAGLRKPVDPRDCLLPEGKADETA